MPTTKRYDRMDELYYASGNPGKWCEVHEFFSQHFPHNAITQLSNDFPEIQTMDQRVIAVDKARQAWNFIKKPVLVDDAGIYFETYRDFPGTLTKFVYQALGFSGLKKLYEPGDRASFRLTMVYMKNPEEYTVVSSRCDGFLIYPADSVPIPVGVPFDLIFVPDGSNGKTYQQLREIGLLHEYNYRISALKSLMGMLK